MASVLEAAGEGTIIAVDIAPQPGTREALAVSPRVELVEGSSTDPVLGDSIRARFGREDVVLVVLDSDHTRDHVRAELEAWSPVASYIVVFDGFMPRVADAPLGSSAWTEDSPRAAIDDFLVAHPEFEVDARYAERFGATFAPSGWLRRLR
jgi:cephalosporin hydroxylase